MIDKQKIEQLVNCSNCNKKLQRKNWQLKKSKNFFCSDKCKKKFQLKPDTAKFYKNLREGSICVRCSSGDNLHVQHNEYSYTEDEDIEILCIKCHNKYHKELVKNNKRFTGDIKIKKAVIHILKALNVNIKDENFKDTPARVSRAFVEMCEGLYSEEEIKSILSTKFPSTYEGMVITKDMQVYSLCPHHLLPVKYIVHVGIIFDKDCIGLSKIPRLVELLAKKPVLQEDLTQDITETIDGNLKTLGTICMVEGIHTCMQARGIKSLGTSVITSSATCKFLNPDANKNPKEEFLFAISKGK